MAERMPELLTVRVGWGSGVVLDFDEPLTIEMLIELNDLIRLKFAGQLRRDPKAPLGAPPPPEAG